MKVTLDACLFGALVAQKHQDMTLSHILDIGTGTGLLSLILAQSVSGPIDAVEIDKSAAHQASANIQTSPFKKQIQVHCLGIEAFQPMHDYDLIICNPPFFTDALKGPNQQRNQARHNDGLSFLDLCHSLIRLLSHQGEAWLLLPVDEMARFCTLASPLGLHLQKQWLIHTRTEEPAYRSIGCFSKQDSAKIDTANLVVRASPQTYSDDFTALLAPYYLKL